MTRQLLICGLCGGLTDESKPDSRFGICSCPRINGGRGRPSTSLKSPALLRPDPDLGSPTLPDILRWAISSYEIDRLRGEAGLDIEDERLYKAAKELLRRCEGSR